MKNKLSILILIYNKVLHESKSIQSFLDSKLDFDGCKLTIWNNGPKKIELDSLVSCQLKKKGFSLDFIQTIENKSLSSIYNHFCLSSEAVAYLILDDDSELDDTYFEFARSASGNNLLLPIITSNGKVVGPLIDGLVCEKEAKVSSGAEIEAIGSGMIIGERVTNSLVKQYGSLFDERFYLYGVDTTFCRRFNNRISNLEVKIIPSIKHSLSKFENESEPVTKFRRKERAYDKGLTMRYYLPRKRSFLLFLKTVMLGIISVTIRRHTGRHNTLDFVKAYVTGRHYRHK